MNTTPQENGPAKLLRTEFETHARLESKRAQLAESEPALAACVLDGTESEFAEASRRVAQLQTDIAALERAVRLVRSRRETAIRAHFQGEAEKLRAEADQKNAERERLIAKVDGVLRKLSELQGIDYDRCICGAQRLFGGPATNVLDGTDHRDCSPVQFYGGEFSYATPATRKLLDQIRDLRRKADELDKREVKRSGHHDDAEDVNGIMAALEADPMHIWPNLDEINDWLANVDRQIPPALSTNKRRYRLVWRDGKIDRSDSVLYAGQAAIHWRKPADTVAAMGA